MMQMLHKFQSRFLALIIAAIAILAVGCGDTGTKKAKKQEKPVDTMVTDPQVDIDFQKIKERGELNAITAYSSTSYFIYRGKQMGYEYELLHRLADYLDVELNIVLAEDLRELFEMLNEGEGDLIAYNLTVTKNRRRWADFTLPHNHVQQVLVQKKPENWRNLRNHQIGKKLLRNPVKLEGDTVHVRKGSSYYRRLKNLSEEIGGDIHIVEAEEGIGTEDLIRRVSEGKIKYTVADENIAKLNQNHYNNIDTETKLSTEQKIAWAVRKNAPKLKDTVNDWINSVKNTTTYNVIYNKYFKNQRAARERMNSSYFSLTSNQISQFDPIFKKYSKNIEYDWLLMASLAYQESKFNPRATSWVGARGLMQLMPGTARQYGARNLFDPEQSVKAGTKYLKWLNKLWAKKVPDPDERRKFILASYNAGQGHVLDARRLTKKYGGDPDKWDDVAKYLRLKANKKYYTDDVVKYGYCRGEEPYHYVKEIMNRYKHYKRFIKDDDEPDVQQAGLTPSEVEFFKGFHKTLNG